MHDARLTQRGMVRSADQTSLCHNQALGQPERTKRRGRRASCSSLFAQHYLNRSYLLNLRYTAPGPTSLISGYLTQYARLNGSIS